MENLMENRREKGLYRTYKIWFKILIILERSFHLSFRDELFYGTIEWNFWSRTENSVKVREPELKYLINKFRRTPFQVGA